MGDNKISEKAVRSMCIDIYANYVGGARRYREECEEGMRAALETALPHLQGEAVPVAWLIQRNGHTVACMSSKAGALQVAEDEVVVPVFSHPQPAELNEVSGNSGELPLEEVTLKQVIDGYVSIYGSLRQAAELMCIDPAYLSRLAGCRKTNPSDEVLGKLGLERRVVYTRKVHDYQPTKLHQRTKCA